MFTEQFFNPDRWGNTHNRVSYAFLGNSRLDENLTMSVRWALQDIRVHFSTGITSVHDFIIRLSSVFGSYFNTVLLSQAINGVRDIFIHFSAPLQLNSNDTIYFSTFASIIVANVAGIEVNGWAVRG